MDWMTVMVAGVVGQATSSGGVAPTVADVQSVWGFVVKGGLMMVPILICSFIALAVVLERTWTLARRRVIPPGFLSGLEAALARDGGRDEALAYCKAATSPIAPIFETAIKRRREPIELLEKHVQEAGERIAIKLRAYLRVLSVIAAITPLMGLLGTIFGMITAFQTVAGSGEALGKTELLAEGIYEALITTAAGLLVAIPVLVCYHWISAKIDLLIVEIDQLASTFIETHVGQDASSGAIASLIESDGNGADARSSESAASATTTA